MKTIILRHNIDLSQNAKDWCETKFNKNFFTLMKKNDPRLIETIKKYGSNWFDERYDEYPTDGHTGLFLAKLPNNATDYYISTDMDEDDFYCRITDTLIYVTDGKLHFTEGELISQKETPPAI